MKKINIVKTFYLDVDNQEDEGYLSAYSEYDQNGHLLVSIEYMGEGEIEAKSIFEYTANGRLSKETRYLSEDEVAEIHTFERDADGRVQQIEIEYADQSLSIKKYNYSENYSFIEIVTTDDEGELEERETRRVDAKNNILAYELYDESGALKDKNENEFDENNDLTRRLEYDAKGELKVEYKYTYSEGNILRRTGFSKKGNVLSDLTYQYDEQGRTVEIFMKNSYLHKYIYDEENKTRTEETYNQSGMLEARNVVTFDDDGHVLTEEKVHHTLRYEYVFFE